MSVPATAPGQRGLGYAGGAIALPRELRLMFVPRPVIRHSSRVAQHKLYGSVPLILGVS